MKNAIRVIVLIVGLVALASLVSVISANAQPINSNKFKVIHDFTGNWDGAYPAGVVLDNDGNLWGTSSAGGTHNKGLVFKMTPAGSKWILTVIYVFGADPDGGYPAGPLVRAGNGVLYGVTNGEGKQVIFSLTPPSGPGASPYWTRTDLHVFAPGEYPNQTLAMDEVGSLYGTTQRGGDNDAGMIYELTHAGRTFTYSKLYSFPVDRNNGCPGSGVTIGSNGYLYGTTLGCGVPLVGGVYVFDWVHQTNLLSFECNGQYGCESWAGVVLDQLGNIYGSSYVGGENGAGVVYKLTLKGNSYQPSVLYSIPALGQYVYGPSITPAFDAAGNLYLQTDNAGQYSCGSIFKLVSPDWHYKLLHDFQCGSDGSAPGYFALSSQGWLYGTADDDGSKGQGLVFSIAP